MSVSKRAKKRGTILKEIMTYEREQLPKRKRAVPIADLRALADLVPSAVSFKNAIQSSGVSVIAECKRASPSKGLLIRNYDPGLLAETYISAGARAISILTNSRYFQGNIDHLQEVKQVSIRLSEMSASTPNEPGSAGVPVLRKDFIFDPYQVYETKAYGADALLLIAAVLDQQTLGRLMELAWELDLDALVEVHTTDELDKVLALNPNLIGINNRNLQTFDVDFENTVRLRKLIPEGILVVGESGIQDADDVMRMAQIGVDAVLVGQALVQSGDIYESTRSLVNAGEKGGTIRKGAF